MRRFLQIALICLISAVLNSCSPDAAQKEMDVSQVLKQQPDVGQVNNPELALPSKNIPENKPINQDNEEKVIVSVDNSGRTNPFQPFHERSIVGYGGTMNLPPPPEFTPDPGITTFMAIKVNGILYDPPASSAIINISDNDYLVHKGDSLFDYSIKDITKDKVVIKYGNNTYKTGVGEIVEIIGDINRNPVRNIQKSFGGGQQISNLQEIRVVTPSSLPSVNQINKTN